MAKEAAKGCRSRAGLAGVTFRDDAPDTMGLPGDSGMCCSAAGADVVDASDDDDGCAEGAVDDADEDGAGGAPEVGVPDGRGRVRSRPSSSFSFHAALRPLSNSVNDR